VTGLFIQQIATLGGKKSTAFFYFDTTKRDYVTNNYIPQIAGTKLPPGIFQEYHCRLLNNKSCMLMHAAIRYEKINEAYSYFFLA
jgi:hypothetical protein